MTSFICETCGTQFAPSVAPPERCPICEDDRQYVGWSGQGWTTLEALAARHVLRIEEEHGLTAIGVEPAFGINQRALLLKADAGNILWECLSLVTDAGVAALKASGGVDMIVLSHPHFYASMVAWSEVLGGAPIYLHEADRDWVQYASPHVRHWSGDTLELSRDVALIRAGGHFPGSTALYWRNAPGGAALFPGDALQVVSDRRHVAFMYSYPNYIPMKPTDVAGMRERLAPFIFVNVFGYTWGRNIIGGGRAAVDASFERYFTAVEKCEGAALKTAS